MDLSPNVKNDISPKRKKKTDRYIYVYIYISERTNSLRWFTIYFYLAHFFFLNCPFFLPVSFWCRKICIAINSPNTHSETAVVCLPYDFLRKIHEAFTLCTGKSIFSVNGLGNRDSQLNSQFVQSRGWISSRRDNSITEKANSPIVKEAFNYYPNPNLLKKAEK